MYRSLRIVTLFGIPLRLHWTFGLIFLYVFYLGQRESWDWLTMAWASGFVMGLFVCVTLHEYGHALMARRFGVGTRDIILSPIGGVARLDRLPSRPRHEWLIAVAGPLVNVGIAALLGIYFLTLPAGVRHELWVALLTKEQNYFVPALPTWGFALIGLFFVNIMLALFNMVPAFPMDGGRVVRAVLSIWVGRVRATWVAARLGQTLAVLFVLFNALQLWDSGGKEGLTSLFIGIFIFMTAQQEYRFVVVEEALHKGRAGDLMRRHFTPLYPADTMSAAVQLYMQQGEKNFLVFDEWQNLLGILPEHRILYAQQTADSDARVQDYMIWELIPTQEQESLASALSRLRASDGGTLPVFNEWNTLVGVLDTAGMDTYLRRLQRS